MDSELKSNNPFRSPAFGGQAKPGMRSDLLKWFVGAMAIMACFLFVFFLLIAEIPCVLHDLEQRNVETSDGLLFVHGLGPFVFKYWYVFVMTGAALFVSGYRSKPRTRRWMAIVTLVAAFSFTIWIAWVTFSASGWRLLYSW